MNTTQNVPNPTAGAEWQAMIPASTSTQNTNINVTRGYNGRLVTGILQTIVGFILFVCGIVVVSVHIPPDEDSWLQLNSAFTDGIDTLGCGIWIGACIIFTSFWGICGKKSQVGISLYMAFSIVVCVFSAVAGLLTFVQMMVCRDWKNSALRNRADPVHPRYVENAIETMRLHVGLYAVMVFCYFVEFVTAITGASFTCIGLHCCSQDPQQNQVIIPMTSAPPAFVPNDPAFVTSKDGQIQGNTEDRWTHGGDPPPYSTGTTVS